MVESRNVNLSWLYAQGSKSRVGVRRLARRRGADLRAQAERPSSLPSSDPTRLLDGEGDIGVLEVRIEPAHCAAWTVRAVASVATLGWGRPGRLQSIAESDGELQTKLK